MGSALKPPALIRKAFLMKKDSWRCRQRAGWGCTILNFPLKWLEHAYGSRGVIVGERAAEMDREEDITGKSVLKCTGCKLQVCLE